MSYYSVGMMIEVLLRFLFATRILFNMQLTDLLRLLRLSASISTKSSSYNLQWRHREGVKLYLYSFFNLGARWGWVVNATPRLLYLRGTDPVPSVKEDGWVPSSVWTGAENLVSIGIRSPCCSARSESLYRLSYPGPKFFTANSHTLFADWFAGRT
jgi:hypothetical protein